MVKIMKVIIPAVLLTVSMSAMAQNAPQMPKVGVFDMQQMMQSSPFVQQLNKQLQDQFKPRQDKLAAMQKDMGNEVEKMNKDGAKMTVEARNKLRDKLIADRTAYQTMAQSYQQDLSAAQNAAMQKLIGQVQAAANMVAKKDGYSLILQRGAVLYSEPNTDVTKEVLADMAK